MGGRVRVQSCKLSPLAFAVTRNGKLRPFAIDALADRGVCCSTVESFTKNYVKSVCYQRHPRCCWSMGIIIAFHMLVLRVDFQKQGWSNERQRGRASCEVLMNSVRTGIGVYTFGNCVAFGLPLRNERRRNTAFGAFIAGALE